MNITLESQLKEYLQFIQFYKAKSTYERVQFTLRMILRELQGELNYENLLKWSQWKQPTLKARTWLSYVSCLNGFLEWSVQENYLLVNPIPKGWSNQKQYPPVRPIPSPLEVKSFLNQPQNQVKFPLRNLAILELCYSVGLRRSEVVSLRLESIQNNQIRVIGKGDKERILPLSSSAKKRIETYLQEEREPLLLRLGVESQALFLSCRGRALKPHDMTHIFNQQLKLSYSPHQFRHACASHMLQNGCSLRVLQRYLGHESLESTQIYTRVDLGDLREMLEKCHLRG